MALQPIAPTCLEGEVRLDGHTNWVDRVVEIPECGLVATQCKDSSVRLFDVVTGRLFRTLDRRVRSVYDLGALGDGLLASVGTDSVRRIWNVETGECVGQFRSERSCGAMARLGSGRFVAADVGDIVFLEHSSGRAVRETDRVAGAHSSIIREIAVCEARVASASYDKTAKVWDSTGGSPVLLATLEGHSQFVNCVDISETHIVTGSTDRTVRVYDGKSFAVRFVISALHTESVVSVRLSANGLLVSFSSDRTVQVLDIQTGRQCAMVATDFQVLHGTILRDGRLVAVGSGPNAVMFMSPVQLLEARVSLSIESAAKGMSSLPVQDVGTSTLESTAGSAQRMRNECASVPRDATQVAQLMDMSSATNIATSNEMMLSERPSAPLVRLTHKLIESSRSLDKNLSLGDLHELRTCPVDGAKETLRMDEDMTFSEEREGKDEKLLSILDQWFPIWIRRLQSLSSRVTEDDKLATIQEMENDWQGWTVSPKDISFDKNASGVAIPFGVGATGHVFRGMLRRGTEKVAVAIKLLADEAAEPKNRIKFMREVLLQYYVSHPNVLSFKGAFWPRNCQQAEEMQGIGSRSSFGNAFVATELMTTNLRDFKTDKVLSYFDKQLMVLLSVAKALEYLHGERIVHQDVSPENVMLLLNEKSGEILEVKLGDFGVSRVVRRTISRTRTTECMAGGGKFGYTAPEALLNNRRLEFSVDVWSFGALCCFVVLGQTPVQGFTEFELFQAVSEKILSKSCAKLANRISNATLRKVCTSCMSEDPSQRPTMREVRRELEALMRLFTK